MEQINETFMKFLKRAHILGMIECCASIIQYDKD